MWELQKLLIPPPKNPMFFGIEKSDVCKILKIFAKNQKSPNVLLWFVWIIQKSCENFLPFLPRVFPLCGLTIFGDFAIFENPKSEFYRFWKSHAFYREKVSKNDIFGALFLEQTPPKKSTFLIILRVLAPKLSNFSKLKNKKKLRGEKPTWKWAKRGPDHFWCRKAGQNNGLLENGANSNTHGPIFVDFCRFL